MNDNLVDVLNALFFVESFDGEPFNVNARKGKGGGQSIAGVTNQTFNWMKREGMIPASSERFNAKDETRAGVAYFNWLMERPYIKGDTSKALAAYHMGPSKLRDTVKSFGARWKQNLPKDTKTHLSNVENLVGDMQAEKILEQNRNLDFVDRIFNPDKVAPIENTDGTISTHKMRAEVDENGQWYVYPEIINENGKLRHIQNRSLDDAKAAGDFIKMPNADTAINFSVEGYKRPTLTQKYQQTSLPTYEPIIETLFEFKNGGYVKKYNQGDYVDLATIDTSRVSTPADAPTAGPTGNPYGQLSPYLGLAGSTLMGINSQHENPSMTADIAGGALQGAGALSSLGPYGMLAGVIGGGLLGAGNYAMNRSAKEQRDLEMRRQFLENNTLDPYQGIPPLAEEGLYVTQGENVQTEEGEMVFLPNLMLSKVAANKDHDQMKRDKVTDMLPDGSYVFSNAVELKKEDAEDLVLGQTITEYTETNKPKEPQEIKFSEFFNKEKQTPAEVAKNIQKKYPINEREDDIFAQRVNELHKESRLPRLQILVGLNEQKKSKKTQDEGIEQLDQGGPILTQDYLINRSQEVLDEQGRLNDQLYAQNQGINLVNLASSSLFNLARNPNVVPFQESVGNLSQIYAPTPNYLYQSMIDANRGEVNSLAASLGQAGQSPRDMSARLSPALSNLMKVNNQIRMEQAKERMALRRQQFADLRGINNRNAERAANAQDRTRQNRNELLSSQGGINSRHLTELSRNLAGRNANLQNQQNQQLELETNLFNLAQQEAIQQQHMNWLQSQTAPAVQNQVIMPDALPMPQIQPLPTNHPTISLPTLNR